VYADEFAFSAFDLPFSPLKSGDKRQASPFVITFWGISVEGIACSLKGVAIPSALMISLFGKMIAALLQSLFVTAKMEP
jgi:hypothetical protein